MSGADNALEDEQGVPSANKVQPLWNNRKVYFLWYGLIGGINLVLVERATAEVLSFSEAALLNLLLTVLFRNDQVVVALHHAAVKLPLRRRATKYVINRMVHQLGGAHSAAALCTIAWLSVACINAFVAAGAKVESVLAATTLALLIAMAVTAMPAIRHGRHDLFERVHRYGGWSALALTFANTVVANIPQDAIGTDALAALAQNPSFVLVTITTIFVLLPWLTLQTSRDFAAEVVAGKVVRLTFPTRGYYGYGSFARISFDFVEWHSFAVALHGPTTGSGNGHLGLLIAAAGDWTSNLVERVAAGRPPSRLWIRRVKPPGFMHAIRAYRRSVVVATGAGIAPALLFANDSGSEVLIVWIAQDPENTLSEVASIVRSHPNVHVHDTKLLGRPDPARVALDAVRTFDAEAVFCVSNAPSTKAVLNACLTEGVPAYGATWDS